MYIIPILFIPTSQTLMKVSRCEHTILERAREAIQKELEEETQERLRKIKKSVLEQLQGAGALSSTGSFDLRKKYASMPAAEVVLAVFSNAEGVFSPRMAKVGARHLLMCSSNEYDTSFPALECWVIAIVGNNKEPMRTAPQL